MPTTITKASALLKVKDRDSANVDAQTQPLTDKGTVPMTVFRDDGSPINPSTAEGIEAMRLLLVSIGGYLDGVESNQAAGNTSLTSMIALLTTQAGYLDGIEGKQDTQTNEIVRIGTRSYGAGQRLPITSSQTAIQSPAITGTEILLHAKSACHFAVGANPTAVVGTAIPLEAGEKFTMRITSGWKVSAIRDSGDLDGFLHIIPVA